MYSNNITNPNFVINNYRRVGSNVVIKPGIEDYRISVEHDTMGDLATATLVIKHLNRSDDGLYTCIALNKVRTRAAAFELLFTIIGIPILMARPHNATFADSVSIIKMSIY